MKRLSGPDKIQFPDGRRPPLGRQIGNAVRLKDGDLVCDVDNAKRRGTVVRAGSEQSEVRWQHADRISVEINRFLRKLGKST